MAFIKGFFDSDKPVAAICHAPWSLVEADVVRGRTLTSWPSLQTDLRNAGASGRTRRSSSTATSSPAASPTTCLRSTRRPSQRSRAEPGWQSARSGSRRSSCSSTRTTGQVVERAAAVLREVPAGHGPGRPRAARAPAGDPDRALHRHGRRPRRSWSTRAACSARRPARSASPPSRPGRHRSRSTTCEVSPKDRYRDMVNEFGAIGRDGRHLRDARARRHRLARGGHRHHRPDAPVAAGRARPQHQLAVRRRAATAGTPPGAPRCGAAGRRAAPPSSFGDPATYDALVEGLMATGAAMDPGMIYFEARLAEDWPTVEIRVADVCTDPDDAVVIAATVRAVATTAAAEWEAGSSPAALAQRAAARGRVARRRATGWPAPSCTPSRATCAPAREVLESLRRPDAPRSGGGRRPRPGHAPGSSGCSAPPGAVRQRAAYERSGTVEGVVADLVDRTEAVWEGRDCRTACESLPSATTRGSPWCCWSCSSARALLNSATSAELSRGRTPLGGSRPAQVLQLVVHGVLAVGDRVGRGPQLLAAVLLGGRPVVVGRPRRPRARRAARRPQRRPSRTHASAQSARAG